MISALLLMLMFADNSKVVPYGISLHQKRTLFAKNEAAAIWVRVGNNSPRELKVKHLPDVMDYLVVTKNGVELEKSEKYRKINLYQKVVELRMNGHEDLGIDLSRLFPDMKKGGVFKVFYRSPAFDLTGKPVKISELDLPNLDAVYRLKTSMGEIDMHLLKEEAPNHVKNFAILVAEGFYKDMIFHRVARGFVIQTGDPKGDGSSGSGFTLDMEWSPFAKHRQYSVGMARTMEMDSADSQFYICLQDRKELNKDYTVFGKVIQGMKVVDSIGMVGTSGPYGKPPNKPFDDVLLDSIEIVQP